MAKSKTKMYCVHGLGREHTVSGGGSMCIGPFRWQMSLSEARSQSHYYIQYEQTYDRYINR